MQNAFRKLLRKVGLAPKLNKPTASWLVGKSEVNLAMFDHFDEIEFVIIDGRWETGRYNILMDGVPLQLTSRVLANLVRAYTGRRQVHYRNLKVKAFNQNTDWKRGVTSWHFVFDPSAQYEYQH